MTEQTEISYSRKRLIAFSKTWGTRKGEYLRACAHRLVKQKTSKAGDVVTFARTGRDEIYELMGVEKPVRPDDVIAKGELEANKSLRRQRSKVRMADWQAAAGRISHGVIGLIKAKFGIDKAAAIVMKHRLSVCESCEQNSPCVKDDNRRCCGKMLDVLKPTKPTCGCVIINKIKVASEVCPLGNW